LAARAVKGQLLLSVQGRLPDSPGAVAHDSVEDLAVIVLALLTLQARHHEELLGKCEGELGVLFTGHGADWSAVDHVELPLSTEPG
jgi:hypothetical protein